MSALYTRVVSSLLFPLHERLKGHDTTRVHRGLEETQWWDAGRLRALQLERLQALVRKAYARVPYYRDLMQGLGLEPADIRCLDDLRRFPFLTKGLIRAHTEALKARGARDLARFNTGGSSGEPLVFFIGRERVSHDVAAKWRATRWWDVDIGDREIVVWGSPIELTSQDRVREVRDRLLRTRLIPAFEMSAHNLDRFVARIRAFRPRMLFGYPSSLSLIARHARAQGQRMDDLGVKVAFVTSERLYDDQRADIQSVFGCRVANGYGGRDAGFIAHECPAGGLHLTAEDIIIELVSPEGSPVPLGDEGEIVVTHLATGDFPFIRYKTGDIGTLSDRPCPCGRGLPVLAGIQGRTTDFVVARDGTVMHGLALIYVLRDMAGIEKFRIVQESLDFTRVQAVLSEAFPNDGVQRIERAFKERLGETVRVKVEPVGEIPAERSGKYRYVVSKVAQQRAG
jgi:phenylacetate-CoA ligase